MQTRVERLTAERKRDFHHVLDGTNEECRACMCTAHYHNDWEEMGRVHRQRMFDRGEMDGYLFYVDDQAAGWCQCTPLSTGLRLAYISDHNDDVWGITCMVLRPEYQRKGLSSVFLKSILSDLAGNDCREVVAVGHRPEAYEEPDVFLELPAAVCEDAGLDLYRDDPVCPLYRKVL